MTIRDFYFVGVAILTTAAIVSGGIQPALWVCGGLVILYSLCLAIVD